MYKNAFVNTEMIQCTTYQHCGRHLGKLNNWTLYGSFPWCTLPATKRSVLTSFFVLHHKTWPIPSQNMYKITTWPLDKEFIRSSPCNYLILKFSVFLQVLKAARIIVPGDYYQELLHVLHTCVGVCHNVNNYRKKEKRSSKRPWW